MTSFTERTVPWAKLGTVIDKDVSVDEAIQLGGLDFDVEKRQAAFQAESEWTQVDNRFAIVRSDNQQFFDFVSGNYEPLQYREAFSFLSDINPRFHAAGVMQSGRQGFLVVQLPKKHEIALKKNGVTDKLDLYIVVRTSHDRTRGVEILLTPLREMCMNQLFLPSFSKNAEQRWSIRHSRIMRDRMADAKDIITQADAYAAEFQSIAQRLLASKMTTEHAEIVLKKIIPSKPRRDTHQIPAILHKFTSSPTTGFPGTSWGLFNAVNEYFEWDTTTTQRSSTESQFRSAMDGSTYRMSSRAWQVLLQDA